MKQIPFLFLFLLVVSSSAQTPKSGYVVRVDGASVWLDLTAADGAAAGRPFTIFNDGAELKHPVTGASLGRVEEKIAEGKIREIAEKYSVGDLITKTPGLKPGQRARLGAALPPPPAPVQAITGLSKDGVLLRSPRSRGATMNFSARAMAVGDFDGAGKPQIVLADEKALRLFAYPAADGKPLAETELSGTGSRVLSLEAADLDGDGRAELFVSVHDDQFRRFETRVYKVEAGKWLKAAEMPFLTRAYQDATGKRKLATQQIVDEKTFPFGAIYPLTYADGKYSQGAPALKPRRADWLYGFNFAKLDAGEGEPATLFITAINSIRVQFAKGQWRTPESYGQSPVRVRWHDRLLEFHPAMLTSYGAAGFDTLYAVRNLAMLGGLTSPFGLFSGGELRAMKWNGVSMETAWTAQLGGFTPGVALVELGSDRRELIVPVCGSAGQSSIWVFDP